jgi:hypothetical protein
MLLGHPASRLLALYLSWTNEQLSGGLRNRELIVFSVLTINDVVPVLIAYE